MPDFKGLDLSGKTAIVTGASRYVYVQPLPSLGKDLAQC
jgi:NAD(P)-dependent dehydrogenase (short-subunit alcohol dehydrogenase family)